MSPTSDISMLSNADRKNSYTQKHPALLVTPATRHLLRQLTILRTMFITMQAVPKTQSQFLKQPMKRKMQNYSLQEETDEQELGKCTIL